MVLVPGMKNCDLTRWHSVAKYHASTGCASMSLGMSGLVCEVKMLGKEYDSLIECTSFPIVIRSGLLVISRLINSLLPQTNIFICEY